MTQPAAGGGRGPVRLLVVRHGPTAWNLESRYTSRTDLPLHASAAGALAPVRERLRGAGVARVLVSPLRRARETVDLLVAGTDAAALPVEVRDDLREVDFGDFEGRTKDDLRTGDLAGPFAAWFTPQHDLVAAPGGETWASAQERARRVLGDVLADGRTALAVSHGYLLKVLVVTAVPEVPLTMVRGGHLPNGGVTELVHDGEAWHLRSAGWTAAA
ncbi:histidine phosphatase family protein [Cellulomonas telluris]|uniref:histidine phosphatase family protein n=1 Tax=Cellulomonas telluris TaxID=2306636 RepID=UPI0010A7CF24|nr:histidine phosphatase family protein [Cellulomonas telluris]